MPTPDVNLDIRHSTSPYRWYQDPGAEYWYATLSIDFSGTRLGPLPAVAVARASLVRVDPILCERISNVLCNLSDDLSVIGQAIDANLDDPDQEGDGIGYGTNIVAAIDVVVDKYWRGSQLGPALLSVAAGFLQAGAVVLSPHALATRVSETGVCYSDYGLPRPSPQAQKKVEAAWRKAGFCELTDEVVWMRNTPENIEDAKARIARMEEEASTAHVRRWYGRRAARRLAALG